jgi:hypothetical protein
VQRKDGETSTILLTVGGFLLREWALGLLKMKLTASELRVDRKNDFKKGFDIRWT